MLRHLAAGGMGDVWLAEAVGAAGFAKRVVIKTMRSELSREPGWTDQFVAEGRLLEQLDHPHIAQILDLGCADGVWFLAMEYVQGYDLRALRRALPAGEGGSLGVAATLAVLQATTAALAHAASRRDSEGRALAIVHHDVTPSNVMVRPDGVVKLVDFGIARAQAPTSLAGGALRGKLGYLAPEQVAGAEVDGRADLFSLGLCCLELLAGARALEVASPTELPAGWQLLPAKIAGLAARHVPPPLLALLSRLMALDPALRPADAAAAANDVAAVALELGVVRPEADLARELAPAFARLDAAASTFDATLADLVSIHSVPRGADHQTLSIPGLASASGASGADGWRGDSAPLHAATIRLDVQRSRLLSLLARRASALGAASILRSPPEALPVAGGPGLQVVAPPAAGDRLVPRRARVTAAVVALAAALWLWLRTVTPEPAPPAPAAASAASASPSSPAPLPSAPGAAAPLAPAPPASQAASPAARPPVVRDAGAPRGGPEAAPSATPPAAPPDQAAQSAAIAQDPTPSAAAAPAADVAAAKPKSGPELRTVRFRVVPADAVVTVDGRPADGAGATGIVALQLRVGTHRVEVRDPRSGAVESRRVVVEAGATPQTLPGFVLAPDLP